MAAPSRPKDPHVSAAEHGSQWEEVSRRLKLEPYRFRFFQALWILEQMSQGYEVGGFGDPRREPVRVGTHPSLAFPASEIQSFDASATPPRMAVNFMGLQGLSGTLPYVYTEFIEERAKAKDRSFNDFLNIFNHRLLTLFYRAWKRHRFPLDRAKFRRLLHSVVGLRTPGLQNRHSVSDESFAYYAGLLGMQARSPVALENLLSDYFQVPVEIEQFVGAWYSLTPDVTCHFEDREDESEQLGLGVVAGDEVWDRQGRVRIRIGPLTRTQYEQFLPGRPAYNRLVDWTRFFSRDQIDFEAQLILRKEDVPGCELEQEPVQLGWTTWMKTKPVFPHDAQDTVLDLRATS